MSMIKLVPVKRNSPEAHLARQISYKLIDAGVSEELAMTIAVDVLGLVQGFLDENGPRSIEVVYDAREI